MKILMSNFQQLIAQKNLDISIVELKDLEGLNRMDAEFYQKKYVDSNILIKSKKCEKIHDISNISRKGIFNVQASNYQEFGIPFVRISNLKNGFVDKDDIIYIPERLDEQESKTSLDNGDVVLSKTAMPASALIQEKCNISQDIIGIRLKEGYFGEYLNVYFLTNYGYSQMERWFQGNVQKHLSLLDARELMIPIAKIDFQKKIAEIVKNISFEREQSKFFYQQAEQFLLKELGLENYQPTERNISIKNSGEVEIFSRMDAEFFQPKYDEIIEKIKAYIGGRDVLANLVKISDEKIKQEADKNFQYVELADIDASLGLVNEFTEIVSQELPSRAQMKITKNDVLVPSVAGSSGKIALIDSEDSNLVASTGFFVLRPDFLNPETILVLMKSWCMQAFLKRTARGMILEATSKDDFKKYILPKVNTIVQQKIADLITQSHQVRNESKKLLEVAKRAVEIFIEEDEEKAMEFISKNV